MILCLGTTPAAQRVMLFPRLVVDEVNRAAITLDDIAGKSINVVKVLHALGEAPFAMGFLGGDRGEEIRAELKRRGIPFDFVAVAARTRQCITVLDESSGTQTELVEESPAVTAAEFSALMDEIPHRIRGSRAVIMSGTLAPGVPSTFYFDCAKWGCDAGSLTVVDAKGAPLKKALEARPGLVKPNRAELEATVGRKLAGETELLAAMRELHEKGAERVVITAGKRPALAFDGTRFYRVQGPDIAARNAIGSGDSFTAGVVWRLLRGDDLGEACRWGTACGAANALSLMPGEVQPAEVTALAGDCRVERLAKE